MHKGTVRRLCAAASLIVGALGVSGGMASPVQAAVPSSWADAATAPIHPGVMMFTEGAQCTANFIFTDASSVYIGYAAHCAGTGAATETNGCDSGSLPINTPVQIDGATRPGHLAYSSWITMQGNNESDANACQYNDFALVRLDPADFARVNPSVPHWGGPNGINTTGNPTLSSIYSYGNSSLRLGITLLSPKTGVSLGTSGGGWTHPVYTVTPGIPGDSGSAMLDAQGRASGVLSTVSIAPTPASNNFGDLSRELTYAQNQGNMNVSLALGTVPFNGSELPLGIG